jgi:hypothetical protein
MNAHKLAGLTKEEYLSSLKFAMQKLDFPNSNIKREKYKMDWKDQKSNGTALIFSSS